jgi:hypothetical protein
MDEYMDSHFTVFPNPAAGQLFLTGQQPAGKLIISDLFGRVRDEFENIMAFPYRIDVSDYPGGIYIIQILTTDNQPKSIKFLKLRE